MIATNEAVDILRNGWRDAASTLAADVPEVAELLQARLEMAISTERLDERNLLDAIQEVESITSGAASPSSQALALRLRRTVYEYLLALDAAHPMEAAAAVDQPAPAPDSPVDSAEEVTALGHPSAAKGVDADPEKGEPSAVEPVDAVAPAHESLAGTTHGPETVPHDEVAVADRPKQPGATNSRRRFALRRRRRSSSNPASDTVNSEVIVSLSGEPVEAVNAPASDPPAAEPDWRFTPPGELEVFESDIDSGAIPPAVDGAEAVDADAEVGTDSSAAPSDDTADPDQAPDPADVEPMAGAPESGAVDEPAPAAAVEEPAPGEVVAAAGFVAPRAGFHIVEDTAAHHPVTAPDEARLEMPTFSADETVPGQAPSPTGENASPDQASHFLAWRPAGAPDVTTPPAAGSEATPQSPAPAEVGADVADVPAPADPQPAPLADPGTAQVEAVQSTDEGGHEEPHGWGVRRPGEAHSGRRGGPAVSPPPIEDDPFENNSKLADIRRRIEERLRKRRCDEAAALLQELAQEAGGRAVAELAMNSGDRCRALGKSNAALNCYLAAARSDPVYELPLSRLADICIDNRDPELAVSYLERIARLYRYRGDDKAAIRIYRRIATVAPYRDDVLGLLMNAHRTGRLE